jgi:hypothetical protein
MVKSTNYDVPRYTVFGILLLFPLSLSLSFWGPNINLSVLLPNNINLRYSISVTVQVSDRTDQQTR